MASTYLIDGSSYIYRAFYALPPLSASDGTPTNAVYGFITMLLKIIREKQPERLAVVFDAHGPCFRRQLYPDYKATRPPMPEDLRPQIPFIKEAVAAFNLTALEQTGFEADDIIATLVRKLPEDDITIVSTDKDLMQLVTPNVRMLDTMKDKTFGPQEVAERFGPSVIDVLALAGDTADNVPGVPGIGEKTAKSLITQFGSLEALLERIDQVAGAKRRENLEQYAQQAQLSKTLVTLKDDLELAVSPEDLRLKPPNFEALVELCRRLDFHRLLADFSREIPEEKAAVTPQQPLTCHIVLHEEELEALAQRLQSAGAFCLCTAASGENPARARLVGLALSVRDECFYIPLRHHCLGAPVQLAPAKALALLRPVLEDSAVAKYGHNLKNDLQVLLNEGCAPEGFAGDVMLDSYIADAGARSHTLERLSQDLLGIPIPAPEEIMGKHGSWDDTSVESAADFMAQRLSALEKVNERLHNQVQQQGLQTLVQEVELPLTQTLAKMERCGIRLDSARLAAFSGNLAERIERLEEQIYTLAGTRFNLASPKQLGEVLFGKMQLPHGKKTKTGWSTDVETLTSLAQQHEIGGLLLEHRSITKLKSTYADALPRLIHPETGRIHTSFNQCVTVTGRLSSSNPNLQNIPVRTVEGRQIREAFIPEDGWLLLSADYSQVELRVLAHIAKEENLAASFLAGEDIHRRTASEIFGIALEQVTSEQRRRAKAINFGIVYGMGAFGLSRQTGVSVKEAEEYIRFYFERYPRIRVFMDEQIACAREKRFVTTLKGRRCPVPDIGSKNSQTRGNAERNAINYPIQGSAADIIKIAMLRVEKRLQKEKLRARMLLQVHDELLFETPPEELEKLQKVVTEEMEQAVALDVPLVVETGSGRNWCEAH